MLFVFNRLVAWLLCVAALEIIDCSAAQRPNDVAYILKPCKPSECVYCKENVMKKLIPDEPLVCDKDAHVKSASCFLCGHQCKTIQDIQNALKDGSEMQCGNETPIEISCCLIAQMSNIGRPTSSGQYKCYSEMIHVQFEKVLNEPLLDCPTGKKGNDCENPYTEPYNCSCYPGNLQFVGQEHMSECNDENQKPTSLGACHLSVQRNGSTLTCLCNKCTELQSKNLGSCSRPHTNELRNVILCPVVE
ncbi:uncharacterized protein LOC123525224 isoform X2 [Mercenaria mercenaria]|uniref:uncharacterized protein LOC123525224 isoform X2 n=1 Tax=Mercenaria mercenaria TaxID=6596 RepID=UPI00234F815A|nr:uncharacterized protein LOC123525224 isoform X2 [Mercenaria mercenaria]